MIKEKANNLIIWHYLCKVTTDGGLARSFGGTRDELDFPIYLAIHENNPADDKKSSPTGHFVFVADYNNKRLVILDSKLAISKWIRMKDIDGVGDCCPSRLWYDRDQRQLLVGLGNNRVAIYSISEKV